MTKFAWNVDEGNQVTYKPAGLGKSKVLVNGAEAAAEKVKRKTTIPFTLHNGKAAELIVDPGFGMGHDVELRVEGQVILSETEKKQVSCIRCGRKAGMNDKFCQKCGTEISGPENQRRIIKLKGARSTIAWVAGMFFVFGIALYFITDSKNSDSISKLASYKETDIYPKPIDGKQMTVGELRQEIEMESWSVLVVNIILAVIMVGLYFYSRRSPLVGLMAALAVYLSVIVLNAILDPKTIGQGIIVKIVVIGLLVNGIRSALELRKVTA